MAKRIARCRRRKWAWVISCVFIAGLYACSIWAQFGTPAFPGQYIGLGPRSGLLLATHRGGLTIAAFRAPRMLTTPGRPLRWWMTSEGRAEWLPLYRQTPTAASAGWEVRLIHMPWWIPFIGAAAMAARAWRADARAWRILSEGLCRQCGYDRKGIAAASRCPECGAAPGA